MTRKQKRLTLIGSAVGVLGLALGLVLFALRDNIVFFYGPTDMVEKHVGPGVRLRIGGLVENGTLVHLAGKSVTFKVTDGKDDVRVAYTGLLPDLFREGQGVVAEGALDQGGVFRADNVLAKHDERYMPREVVDALKKQGKWAGASGQANGQASGQTGAQN
jgi:cytochrome c-type biogenesis protein CcmE